MPGQIDRTLSTPIYKGKCPVSCGIRPPSFHCGGTAAGKWHGSAGRVLCSFASYFQDLNKSMSISLCSLRMDKTFFRMYNKTRNQRSTAEAQMRANPADLKQKGARPMVDMEPAQQGQAVGIRWEAKQRLTTNGMFPPYKNTTNTSQSWASILRYNDNLSINLDPRQFK